MTTNGYHPIARCEKAKDLYFEWVEVTKYNKRGSSLYVEALNEYIAHIQGGCNCRRGLGK